MRNIIFISIMASLIFLISNVRSAEVSNQTLYLPIISIYDGDTIKTSLPLPVPLDKVSIRILGIDTPESTWRAKCLSEKELGLEAKAFVKNLADGYSIMEVTNFKWDKYGSRIDGIVTINGINVGQALIDNGLAKEYYGGKKESWCQ